MAKPQGYVPWIPPRMKDVTISMPVSLERGKCEKADTRKQVEPEPVSFPHVMEDIELNMFLRSYDEQE